jgi:Barrel-sandwich domain of CusB or HlyD membrane-fusion
MPQGGANTDGREIDIPVETDPVTEATEINAFAAQIHQSLDPRRVAIVAAHELRPILLCDRICFLERRHSGFRLVAASDQGGNLRRSRQAVFLERAVAAAIPNGERFLFPDCDLELPDELGKLLASYWELSRGQMILIEPVFSRPNRHENSASTSNAKKIVGALVIEKFSETPLNPEVLSRLKPALEHLTIALANAQQYSQLVKIPGLYPLGLFLETIRRTRTATIFAWLMSILSLLAGAAFIHRPFEIECSGRLMPSIRREVFAGIEGEVIEVLVNESDHVEEGQVIARLKSRELEKSLLDQTGHLSQKMKARDAARADLRTRSTPQARGQSARDQAQLEILNSEIETIHRQLELLERQKEQLVIQAPISGTITTDRSRERLLNRPVHRGESLLEIMDEAGAWQLELAIPERKSGHFLSFHQHQPKVPVKFRLLSMVPETFDCEVTRLADRIVVTPESVTGSLIFCDVSNLELPTRQIGSEVSARIQCGKKSFLFLWFHEFWELLQRHWWL